MILILMVVVKVVIAMVVAVMIMDEYLIFFLSLHLSQRFNSPQPEPFLCQHQGQLPSAATHDLQLILQSRDSGLPSSDHTSPAGSGMLDQQVPLHK